MTNPEYRRTLSLRFLEHEARPNETLEQTCSRWMQATAVDMPSETRVAIACVQAKLLELLNFLDTTCKDNGLGYWLHGRAYADALLFGKFGPWSVSADIAMTRTDFLKFHSIVAASGDFRVKYDITDKGLFPRLMKSNDGKTWVGLHVFDMTRFSEEGNARIYWEQIHLPFRHKLEQELVGSGTTQERYRICGRLLADLNYTGTGTHLIPDITGVPEEVPDAADLLRTGDVFPTHRIPFGNLNLQAPNNKDAYVAKQLGEVWLLPERWGLQSTAS